MERIMVVCRSKEDASSLIKLLNEIFPECEIVTVSKDRTEEAEACRNGFTRAACTEVGKETD